MLLKMSIVPKIQDEFTLQVKNQVKIKHETNRLILELQEKTKEVERSVDVAFQAHQNIIEVA